VTTARSLCSLALALGTLAVSACAAAPPPAAMATARAAGVATATPPVATATASASATVTPPSPTTTATATSVVATVAAVVATPEPPAVPTAAPPSHDTPTPASTPPAPQPAIQRVGEECVVPVLRRHPLDLAPYDPATGRAGDVVFQQPVQFDRIFTQFGFVIPASSSATGSDKPNPQPAYLAPMGTLVHSLVDGVVDQVASLWSTATLGDVSVMVKPDGLPDGCYVVIETEHVTNPRVAAGDRVTAGEVIAEVSPLNSQSSGGLGVVELGILTGAGNGHPLHVCPYKYFAPDVAATQLAALQRLMSDWEAYMGNPSLWDESAWVDGVPGCSSGPMTE
jgi:murein DD-endopeptidase MepM/ murein hydrolase activator NlpD